MKDIDGGLHPAVDGQSLDDDDDRQHVLVEECKGVWVKVRWVDGVG